MAFLCVTAFSMILLNVACIIYKVSYGNGAITFACILPGIGFILSVIASLGVFVRILHENIRSEELFDKKDNVNSSMDEWAFLCVTAFSMFLLNVACIIYEVNYANGAITCACVLHGIASLGVLSVFCMRYRIIGSEEFFPLKGRE